MIPYSFGGAIFSASSGVLVSRIGRYRPIMWFAWSIMTVGWGLMIMLDDQSSKYVGEDSNFCLVSDFLSFAVRSKKSTL